MQQDLTPIRRAPRAPALPARSARRTGAAVAAFATLALATVVLVGTAMPSAAQGLFAPAIRVNENVITRFELEQRQRFLELLGAPGDTAELARMGLIDDRLKDQAIVETGVLVAPEDIQLGIDEFASRSQLSADELLEGLDQAGVAPETLRDFVATGIAWRDVIRQRFLERARPTDAEIDRALGTGGTGGSVRVLLSEIIIPVTAQTFEEVDALSKQLAEIDTFDAFSRAAERYSATETAADGGRMPWMSITELPPGLRPIVLALEPGEVTAPLQFPNAVGLFQLRDIAETAGGTPRYASIEFARYFIPGGRSPEALARAAEIAAIVDTCDDLYGIAKDQPDTVLERVTEAPGEIPRDEALELAKLDADEISVALTRNNGQTLVFLMLCGRTAEVNEEVTREEVVNALVQQRLAAFAESYLAQLRAEAVIIDE
jgi:peptidyl-prolyl cis-trans isomerase SurA